MRARPLPSAARMAISRCRAAPRASSMLATLTQAMTSTITTAPSSSCSTGFTGPTRSSSRGTARCVQPVCSGRREAIRAPTTARSACALRKDMEGLSRPNALM